MAKAKRSAAAWRSLTPDYRNRLTRTLGNGDANRAQARYLSGASLKAARGKPETEAQVRRQRGQARGLTPSQARGRPRPGEQPASEIGRAFSAVPIRDSGSQLAGTRLVDLPRLNAVQASVIGRYLHNVRQLLDSNLSVADFESRWRGRQAAGQRLEDRADRVVETLRQQGPASRTPRYQRFSKRAVSRRAA